MGEEEKHNAELSAPAGSDVVGFDRWADRAVRRIWSKAERRAVRAELEDHYQDRMEACLVKGMEPRAARAQAVLALGDPEETAALLARVHQPVLWLLLVAARVLVALVLVGLAVVFATDHFTTRPLELYDLQSLADSSHWQSQNEKQTVVARRKAVCNGEVAFGPFRVSCESGGIHLDRVVSTDPYGVSTPFMRTDFSLVLSYRAAPWHQMRADVADRVLRMVDNRGVSYYSVADFRPHGEDPSYYYYQYTGRVRPGVCATVLYFQELDPEIKWLEIWFEQGDTVSERLRVNLSPWAYEREKLPPSEHIREDAAAMEAQWPDYWRDMAACRQVEEKPGRQTGNQAEGFSALRVVQSRYELDELLLGQLELEPDDEAPERRELVRCVLKLDSYSDQMPDHGESLDACFRVRPLNGARAERVWFSSNIPLWYQDCCLLRLDWPAVAGTDQYEISWTDPGTGEEKRITISLGEEAQP